jgi:hypothetical protein
VGSPIPHPVNLSAWFRRSLCSLKSLREQLGIQPRSTSAQSAYMDFDRWEIRVRDGRGGLDRLTALLPPEIDFLRRQSRGGRPTRPMPGLTALANASANLDCARGENDRRRCDLLNDEASNRVAFAQSH